jgi:hypothetical protein
MYRMSEVLDYEPTKPMFPQEISRNGRFLRSGHWIGRNVSSGCSVMHIDFKQDKQNRHMYYNVIVNSMISVSLIKNGK